MDFPLEINGGAEAKVSMYSAYNVYPIRGASFAQKRGADRYEFFGGTTHPILLSDSDRNTRYCRIQFHS